MAKTPNGATSPYASASDMLDYFDWRIIGDLVRDDGTEATQAALLTDTKLAAALNTASGQVESACLVAELYTAADLEALNGNSQAQLKYLVCGLAYQVLRQRRGIVEEGVIPQVKDAREMLQKLRDGERIFSFAETEAAGLPTVSQMTTSDWYCGLPTLLSNNSRFFGIRSDRRNTY